MTVRVVKMLINTLYERIKALPDDIKTKIYKEYFEPKIVRYRLTYILHRCNTSIVGYSNQLLFVKMIKNVLNNEEICKYLVKTCDGFGRIYEMYLNDSMGFKLITDKYEKFAVSWLYHTFH